VDFNPLHHGAKPIYSLSSFMSTRKIMIASISNKKDCNSAIIVENVLHMFSLGMAFGAQQHPTSSDF
jgi:hypothetical protein